MKKKVIGETAMVRLISRKDLAERWGISQPTLMRNKELKPIRIGKRVLYHPDDIERFLESKRTA